MCLCLPAEDVHLVLVEALVRAELELRCSVLEVYVGDGVSNVATPVTGFSPLECGSPRLTEAEFGAELVSDGLVERVRVRRYVVVTPSTVIWNKREENKF